MIVFVIKAFGPEAYFAPGVVVLGLELVRQLRLQVGIAGCCAAFAIEREIRIEGLRVRAAQPARIAQTKCRLRRENIRDEHGRIDTGIYDMARAPGRHEVAAQVERLRTQPTRQSPIADFLLV